MSLSQPAANEPARSSSESPPQVPPGRRDPLAPARPPRSRRRKILARVLYTFYLLAILEIGARAFWCIKCGVPLFRMQDILVGRFYPELRRSNVLTTSITKADGYYDVLLLGGSVVSEDCGPTSRLLQEQLTERIGQPVRVFNCANLALSSRDSLIKYRMLADKEFDLVIHYEAINEIRMNNCSREMFKPDYSHSSWYRRIEGLSRHKELPFFVLPYSVEYLVVSSLDTPGAGWYIPRNFPIGGNWNDDGLDIKTEESFRRHLTEMIELADERGAQVLLMGYACYIPSDYTLEKFQAQALDYSGHVCPVESWGTPEGVTAGVAAHNVVLRELGASFPHVFYVDQDALIPKSKLNFIDPCHLTAAGRQTFVDNIKGPIAQRVEQARLARKP